MPLARALEDGGLARFGRADDQPSLPAANGRKQIDHARGNDVGFGGEAHLLVWKDRRQLVKGGAALGLFRVQPVHRFYFEQPVVLFRIFWRAHLANHQITCTQAKAPNLALAHVHIFRPRQQVIATQKANVILNNF